MVPMEILICSYSKAGAFTDIHLILCLSPPLPSFPHKWGFFLLGIKYDVQIGRVLVFSAGLF